MKHFNFYLSSVTKYFSSSVSSLLTIRSSSSSTPEEGVDRESGKKKSITNETFYLQFTSGGENIGRVILEVYDDVGEVAQDFKSFITGEMGFGYKGSRIYALNPGEWCLVGDLLYDGVTDRYDDDTSLTRSIASTDPNVVNHYEDVVSNPRIINRGNYGSAMNEPTPYLEQPGSLVAIASSVEVGGENLIYCQWAFGPQFKIILKEPLISSGRVFGQVISGLPQLKEISERAASSLEPLERIVISDCGRIW